MPAAHPADSKIEEKPLTAAADSSTETKPEAKDSTKPNESAVSSPPSSSAAPAEPTPSTSDKSPETSTTTSEAPSSITAADAPEDSTEDVIDIDIFQQIVDLDDEEDETHEFAVGMAEAFFDQAEQTFKDMDVASSKKNLAELSSLGHFLKGSAAALGVKKVQASCEDIQHYGLKRDETAGLDLSPTEALQKINDRIEQAKKDYVTAEKWLKKWIADNATPAEED